MDDSGFGQNAKPDWIALSSEPWNDPRKTKNKFGKEDHLHTQFGTSQDWELNSVIQCPEEDLAQKGAQTYTVKMRVCVYGTGT